MTGQIVEWCEARINRQTALFFALLFPLVTAALQIILAYAEPSGGKYMPYGYDFPAFWTAGRLYFTGGLEALYNILEFERVQQTLSDQEGILLWHYPPTFLLLIAPFGKLSYPLALLMFTGLSLSLWAVAVPRFLPERSLLGWASCFAAPAVVTTLVQGQNSLIFAAFIVLAFRAREAGRLWLSASLIALVLAKPHLGVLIPIALIAARDQALFWRTCVTCFAFLGIVTAVLGPAVWVYFVENLPLLRFAMAQGDLWLQQVTAFSTLSLLGIPAPLPVLSQALSAGFSVWIVAAVWRRGDIANDMKLAMLLLATLLVSPYAFRYDMVLSLAGTMLVARLAVSTGFLPAEKLLLTLLWVGPAILPNIAAAVGIQLGLPLLLLGVYCCWRRISAASVAPA